MQKPKQIIKRIVDLAMIVLLPLLMAEILVGQEIHEWLGASMLALFLAHHLLNLGWWKSFHRGKHTPSRAFGTALDLLLLLDMAALGVSGTMMSGFVFAFLPISGGMLLARRLHLFASYWGLILMSAHLGVHMELFMGMGRKLFRLSEKSAARAWLLRIAAAAVSVYGLYAIFTQHITEYLFLQTHFVLFDETKAVAVYFAETVAMIVLFAVIAYAVNKLLRAIGKKFEKEKTGGQGWKALSFVIPALVCVLAAVGLNLPSQNEPWQSGPAEPPTDSGVNAAENEPAPAEPAQPNDQPVAVQDGFVFIKGGSCPALIQW